MRIIDIICQSADLLGLTDVRELVDVISEENEEILLQNKDIMKLFNLVKFSVQEICTNYMPVLVSKTIKTENCKYPLNQLSNFIRIQGVERNNELVKYKIINRSMSFLEDGEYEVSYCTYPDIVSVYEDIDFLQNFSADVIVYSLCAYYSLAQGLFEEFKGYHEIYLDKAENLKELRVFTMPQRSWQ